MEFCEGAKVTDKAYLEKHKIEREEVWYNMYEGACSSMLRHISGLNQTPIYVWMWVEFI